MEKNLAEMIEQQAAGMVKAMHMPGVKTTTLEKEQSDGKAKRVFKTRVFAILDDVSAEAYSSFINFLMERDSETSVMREVENWTKDGELIRVVDYIEVE